MHGIIFAAHQHKMSGYRLKLSDCQFQWGEFKCLPLPLPIDIGVPRWMQLQLPTHLNNVESSSYNTNDRLRNPSYVNDVYM